MASPSKVENFHLGDWRVEPEALELIDGERVVRIEGKPMAVLVELALRAGEVVRRDELLDAVWGDQFVSEEVLTHGIWEIRRALGDDAPNPSFLKTVPRRGYRLIAPVTWDTDTAGPDSVEGPAPQTSAETVSGVSAGGPTGAPAASRRFARRRLAWGMGLVAMAMLAGLAAWLGWPKPSPVRVAVPRPDIQIDTATSLDYVSAAVHSATLDALATLPRVAVLSAVGGEGAEPRATPRAIARAEAADEVLMAELRLDGCLGARGQVTPGG